MNETLLTLEEVASILKVSMPTIRRYVHRDKDPLPVIYLSSQEIRIKKEDLTQWWDQLEDPRRNV